MSTRHKLRLLDTMLERFQHAISDSAKTLADLVQRHEGEAARSQV
ncbi:hypothetical protein OPU71_02190 [Niveibacterium sp. 24ML]|nr:hypothetical protein [Niveibacterium sp. 24ML]MCX9154929.1 hypothetical protein [Niveibacterium sp. 24ML]